MDRKRIHEIAEQAHYSRLSLNDPIGSIEEGILVAIREALGPPTQEMIEAAFDKAELFLDTDEDIADAWTAMAAVRLRGMTEG